ncbi:hypothetical protein CDAR_215971 [Caerostris darwini]|uniref:Ig-like domain-containing protein n=1 Tax=Caerostris darwini TaxID=1538125 RepID=A0AAV4NKU2_9ARAC|nr:hypothetical protein CDAR_215971 [Caerostris darwini]
MHRVLSTCTRLSNSFRLLSDTTPVKEEESSSNLKTTSTSITLSPKLDDNGAIYSCVAEHKALSRPLRTNVFLSVLCWWNDRNAFMQNCNGYLTPLKKTGKDGIVT